MSDSFGMMEGAYFVGRNELLAWLNDLLQLGYTKIEHTCTGAAHCQLMDAIYPGKVPLHKVNFNAKFEYDYVKNFKVLQDVFTKLGVDKYIDVQKLVKGKHQDNLEFCQWMKRYFDLHFSGDKYNAVERRAQAKVQYEGDRPSGLKENQPGPANTAATATAVSATGTGQGLASKGVPMAKPKPAAAAAANAAAAAAAAAAAINPRAQHHPKAAPTKPKARVSAAGSTDAAAATELTKEDEYKAKLTELNQQVADLRLTVEGLEKERDFYFGKLRDIEVLCQTADPAKPAAPDLLEKIQAVLYATDEDAAQEETSEDAVVKTDDVISEMDEY